MLAGVAWSAGGRADGFDLSLSKGRLSASEILDSSTSPPARYLLEIGRRIAQGVPKADYIAVANPLLPVKLGQLTTWLQGTTPRAAIISDKERFPLVYILPRRCFDEFARIMVTLSTVDASIDARLLTAILGQEVEWRQVPSFDIGSYPLSTSTGWFQGRDRQKCLKILAANALRIVEDNPAWRDVPLAVYHPYHAGSIVFFAAGAAAAEASLFQRHIICSSYRDIAVACDHKLEPIWLKLPWLPRDNSVGEPQYFSSALDRLGDGVVNDNFIVFMRYSRGTGASPFHRIDHDRFSLGDLIQEAGQTTQEKPASNLRKSAAPVKPLKVLFHITGGLPIKNYPVAYAKVVMRTLNALGIAATVIGRPDLEPAGARSIEADETDLLVAAVEDHHIFVGLDSFPHHFVRNIMGWPTLGLFGTTSAANFGGGWNAHYQSLDAALPCHPCGGETTCPMFGYKECSNYIKPQHLIAAILAMAERVYGYVA